MGRRDLADITNEQIAAVFGVMAACPQHTFMTLTKRARRMREWFEWVSERARGGDDERTVVDLAAFAALPDDGSRERFAHVSMAVRSAPRLGGWPLPNVHVGVSAEDQDAADERIPHLLATPAAVRYVSAEPLLGPLNLALWVGSTAADGAHVPGVDLVIAGCESGSGARPCDVAWLRTLRDQCAEAGAAYFLKQARGVGDWKFGVDSNGRTQGITCGTDSHRKPGGVIGAPCLDGVQHLAMPTTETK